MGYILKDIKSLYKNALYLDLDSDNEDLGLLSLLDDAIPVVLPDFHLPGL